MYTSFLTHEGGRYFWLTLALVLICSALYIGHEPPQPANGGTWLGYGLGTIGALLILWLMYFGRRKRDYMSQSGTVRGWLSAHVYLGTGLLFIATLHAGFQLSANVHGLAYVLMCIVIFSGFFGAWAYTYYPTEKNQARDGQSMSEMFLTLEELNRSVDKLNNKLSDKLSDIVTSAIERTEMGGSFWRQLSATDNSLVTVDDQIKSNLDQQPAIDALVNSLSKSDDADESDALREIIELFGARQRLLRTMRRDIQIHGLIKVWLYLHVPLSFALFAALFAHIVSVFIYW